MLYQLKSYLKFLWQSKNEHGVHSPFVFHLVTKCFYDKTKYSEYHDISKKGNRFLFRVMRYFLPDTLLIQSNDISEKKALSAGNSNAQTGNPENARVIYFENIDNIEWKEFLPFAANDTVWIFKNIHHSKTTDKAWESLKNNPKVTVTIDTYKWGFVFFRKEQEKEHFVIRI